MKVEKAGAAGRAFGPGVARARAADRAPAVPGGGVEAGRTTDHEKRPEPAVREEPPSGRGRGEEGGPEGGAGGGRTGGVDHGHEQANDHGPGGAAALTAEPGGEGLRQGHSASADFTPVSYLLSFR